MRIFRFLLLICILTSCDHPKKPFIEELTWPKRTVKLDNDLGILSIRLPKEFDTFYKYDYTDDNPCSDFRKYKFQNNSFPILKEDGGWVAKNVDSIFTKADKNNDGHLTYDEFRDFFISNIILNDKQK
ncbi:MAG: hypothetical protein EOP53_01580 [Sphingobacteriales bacterium]|nr:MAG: hypothetical protein EOP53_01580 [Sphingobacteriales bacterium]